MVGATGRISDVRFPSLWVHHKLPAAEHQNVHEMLVKLQLMIDDRSLVRQPGCLHAIGEQFLTDLSCSSGVPIWAAQRTFEVSATTGGAISSDLDVGHVSGMSRLVVENTVFIDNLAPIDRGSALHAMQQTVVFRNVTVSDPSQAIQVEDGAGLLGCKEHPCGGGQVSCDCPGTLCMPSATFSCASFAEPSAASEMLIQRPFHVLRSL